MYRWCYYTYLSRSMYVSIHGMSTSQQTQSQLPLVLSSLMKLTVHDVTSKMSSLSKADKTQKSKRIV